MVSEGVGSVRPKMKNPRILPLFCYLICLFVLCFLACGGGEDVETEMTNPLAPTDTSSLTTDRTGELDAFILRLESIYADLELNARKIDVPRNWEKVEDPALRAAYARFLLIKRKWQFHIIGSIRQIRFYAPNTTGLNSSNSLETFRRFTPSQIGN